MIMEEVSDSRGTLIDFSTGGNGFVRLLHWLTAVGDFHRRPLPSGGFASVDRRILYIT